MKYQKAPGRKDIPCPRLLHTKPPRLPLRKPGRFVCFRGAFSGAHAKPCEGSFGKPRVCGEKARTLIVQDEPQGSPPPMRGKVCDFAVVAVHHGIIPAYAGKSAIFHPLLTIPKDHPRVCGEKLFGGGDVTDAQGSPPRMRGKVPPCAGLPPLLRITPAYAGKRG